MRRLFPAAYISGLGFLVLSASLVLAILAASADPIDHSTQAKERAISIGALLAAIGGIYFLASVSTTILWLADKPQARRAVVALAVLGTLFIALGCGSLGFAAGFTPILLVLLTISDIIVIKVAYFPNLSVAQH